MSPKPITQFSELFTEEPKAMNDQQQSTKFDEWAVVELFGHQRSAGKVSEATIGGCAFVRVDVPETEHRQAYTKFFGNGAIYAMTPCSEEVARTVAAEIERWSKPIAVEMPKPRQPALVAGDEDAENDDLPY